MEIFQPGKTFYQAEIHSLGHIAPRMIFVILASIPQQANPCLQLFYQIVHKPRRRDTVDHIMIDQYGQMQNVPFLDFSLVNRRLLVQRPEFQAKRTYEMYL